MKKIIHLIICGLLISLFFQPLKASGGLSCSSAVQVVQDTNRCVFNGNSAQWFKIRVPFGKKLLVSNCGFTTDYAYLYWYFDCDYNYASHETNYCSDQRTTIGMFEKDTTIYFQWQYYSTDSFNFICKLYDAQPGEFPQTAIKATEGIFNTFSNDNKVWYKYTAEYDCKLSIKGIDPNDNGYIYIYNDSLDQQLAYSSYPINSSVVLKKDEIIYFYISYYNNSAITCELKAEPTQNVNGRDCFNSVNAKVGLNRVDNSQFNKEWFKYKATQNGVLTVSTCGLTNYSTYLGLMENNENSADDYDTKDCGDQDYAYYKISAGDSVFIVWSSYENGIYDFDLKFTPLTEIPGSTPATAISAVQGTNTVNDIRTNQWFKIVAPDKNSIHISTCGLSDEESSIFLYKGYPQDYYDASSENCENGYQSKLYDIVNKGDTCYIEMYNLYAYNKYDFNIEFKPLSSEAKIYDFNIYKSSWDTSRILMKKTINPTTKTIDLVVSKNQSLSGYFYAFFKISDGAILTMNGYALYNGISSLYSSPLTLQLISEDSSKIETWTVTLTNSTSLSSDHNFYSFYFSGEDNAVIDTANHTVKSVVAYDRSVRYLYPYFKVAANSLVKRGFTTINSGWTSHDYTNPDTLTVVAEDGSSQKWVVTVEKADTPKGATCEDALPAILGRNDFVRDAYVYYTLVAPKKGLYSFVNNSDNYMTFYIIKDSCDSYNDYYLDVNYNDSIVVGADAGETLIIGAYMYSGYWTIHQLPIGTGTDILSYDVSYNQITNIDHLNHKVNILVPHNYYSSYDYVSLMLSPGAIAKIGDEIQSGSDYVDLTNDIIYTVVAQDGTTQDWTVSVKPMPALSGKDFISFSVPCQTSEALIDPDNATIKVSISDTVTYFKMIPYFILSEAANAKISTTTQYSGNTLTDFSSPVTYKVTAEDNSTKNWVVTLVKGDVQNSAANIISFHLPLESSCIIDSAAKTINIGITSTTFTNQVASFTLSQGATAKIGTTQQVSGTTINDFSSAKVYTVTSEDGSTTKNWTVTVSKAKNKEAEFLTYSIPNGIVVINDLKGLINVVVPNSTNLNALVATFTVSDMATVKIGSATQVSGTTANDFTNPVYYGVTAEDGTTKMWTVTVTKALIGEANILSVSYMGHVGLINVNTKTISVSVPLNVNLTSVALEFAISDGAIARVDGIEQVSGVTENDFTTAVDYVITSQDGKVTNTYHVIVKHSNGINNLSDDLQLYPNPATDYVNLKLNGTTGKIKIELINLLGSIVYSNTYTISNNVLQINLSNIKNGSYFLRITNNNSSVTRKVEVVK